MYITQAGLYPQSNRVYPQDSFVSDGQTDTSETIYGTCHLNS